MKKYIIWDYNTGRYTPIRYRHETSARNAIRGFARRDVKRAKHQDYVTAKESYLVEKTPGKR